MAMHETEDSKVFQRFKKKTGPEPYQVENGRAKKKKVFYFFLCPSHGVCSYLGDTLQSRGLSLVGLLSAHPLRAGYPTMHLWCQEDV